MKYKIIKQCLSIYNVHITNSTGIYRSNKAPVKGGPWGQLAKASSTYEYKSV